jgi:MraZ protein
MLVGEFTHTLDDKKRLSLPAKFRSSLGKSIVITRGLDGCLFVYSTSEWKSFTEKLKELSMGSSDSRAFTRYMLSGAVETDVDASGRILIPDYLKDFAGFSDKIIVAGVGNRAELWAESTWKQYSELVVGKADVLAEKLGDLGMV